MKSRIPGQENRRIIEDPVEGFIVSETSCSGARSPVGWVERILPKS